MKAILFHAIPLVVLVVLSAANVHSQGIDLSLSREGQAAYDTLLVAQRLESDAIGYSAAPSRLVKAYNVILNEAIPSCTGPSIHLLNPDASNTSLDRSARIVLRNLID